MLFTQMNLWIAQIWFDNEKKFESKLIIEWLWSLEIYLWNNSFLWTEAEWDDRKK